MILRDTRRYVLEKVEETEAVTSPLQLPFLKNLGRRMPETPFNLRVTTRRNPSSSPTTAMDDVDLEDRVEEDLLEDTSHRVCSGPLLQLLETLLSDGRLVSSSTPGENAMLAPRGHQLRGES